ncbi:MAG: hypothetical protein AMR96_01600 [Candidatus Adiutrix intracellularis]|jgi:GH35 family endo-1,4-beta-xylanase|nr:MAG: hypothetical protein AMR96_01600 [Candidatus Adiutrix intracellularis]MDR2827414.1 hypothetical protein [Candidatus Adiutrix intracellularis]
MNKDIAEILKEGLPIARRALEIEMVEDFIATVVNCYSQMTASEILAETVREAARQVAEVFRLYCPQSILADLYEV